MEAMISTALRIESLRLTVVVVHRRRSVTVSTCEKVLLDRGSALARWNERTRRKCDLNCSGKMRLPTRNFKPVDKKEKFKHDLRIDRQMSQS